MANLRSLNREAIPSGGRAVFTAYNKKIADDIASKLAQPERHFEPSPYQRVIFDWVLDPGLLVKQTDSPYDGGSASKNAMIEAVAGAGKTTTLVKICKLLNMRVSAATFHSIGLRAWTQAVGRAEVKGEKIEDLMEDLLTPKHLRAVVGKLVSLAKQRGLGISSLDTGLTLTGWYQILDHFDLGEMIPEYETEEKVIELARLVLRESVDQAERVIDFDDMIYMPLCMDVAIPQYDWVLVDEYQDTNPTRRELARRMLAPSGRFVGVGDPHQAIYGFTGADNDSMEIGVELFNCVRLPLTVTYRCPKAVVRHAQQWVSHIEAHETAPEGTVTTIDQKTFLQVYCSAPRSGVMQGLYNPGEQVLQTSDAILCRNTRPLIELAFDLIKKRIPCHVEGRDIGQGLISLVKKWKTPRNIRQFQEQLEDWAEAERAKFLRRGRKDKLQSLEDKVGTLQVFIAALEPTDGLFKLIESINSLFKDTETGKKAATVTLSTVHKSKGREWPRVFLLGRNKFMPSPYAKQGWQIEQEKNLIYVAVTRAMQELIEVRYPLEGEEVVPDFELDVYHPEPEPAWPLPRPASLPTDLSSPARAGLDEPSAIRELLKTQEEDPVLKLQAFLRSHGVTEERWRHEYENEPAPLSEEERQILHETQGESAEERRQRFIEESGGAAGGTWGSDEEYERELRDAWIAEQEEMRRNGMTDLSEEG